MGTPGVQKINRYGLDFKLKAVQMSNQPGVLVKDVAESLCIHPFMMSKWRKQVRDGVLKGKPPLLELQRWPAATAASGQPRWRKPARSGRPLEGRLLVRSGAANPGSGGPAFASEWVRQAARTRASVGVAVAGSLESVPSKSCTLLASVLLRMAATCVNTVDRATPCSRAMSAGR